MQTKVEVIDGTRPPEPRWEDVEDGDYVFVSGHEGTDILYRFLEADDGKLMLFPIDPNFNGTWISRNISSFPKLQKIVGHIRISFS